MVACCRMMYFLSRREISSPKHSPDCSRPTWFRQEKCARSTGWHFNVGGGFRVPALAKYSGLHRCSLRLRKGGRVSGAEVTPRVRLRFLLEKRCFSSIMKKRRMPVPGAILFLCSNLFVDKPRAVRAAAAGPFSRPTGGVATPVSPPWPDHFCESVILCGVEGNVFRLPWRGMGLL